MPAHDPRERSLHGRYMAARKWAVTDPLEGTRAARAKSPGALPYWLLRVDPDNALPEAERIRRAESARHAYFIDLARKSAKARRGRGTAA